MEGESRVGTNETEEGQRMHEAYGLGEIAAALGITKRSAQRRSTKGKWPFETRRGRGGAKRFFRLAVLPGEVQVALMRAARRRDAVVPVQAAASPSDAQMQAVRTRYESVPPALKDMAQLRLRALQAVEALVDKGNQLLLDQDTIDAEIVRLEGERIRVADALKVMRELKRRLR